MKKESKLVRVIDNIDLGGGRFRLRLDASDIHLTCSPGQFFNLAFIDESPYLPRPFSVYELDHKQRQLDLLIADVGIGTRKLSQCKKDDELLLIGPLGQGFPIQNAPEHIFVAGSIGLAPFIEFHREIKKIYPTNKQILIYGARNKEELVDVDFLKSLDWEIHLCTDDGSVGHKGYATEILKSLNFDLNAMIYTCGPTPMMEAVWNVSSVNNLWVSMEEHMACGIGICKGCVVYNQKSPPPLKTICKSGPVFNASEIFAPSTSKMTK